jgi:hypothetical protein
MYEGGAHAVNHFSDLIICQIQKCDLNVLCSSPLIDVVSTVICFLRGSLVKEGSYSAKLATVISDAIAFVKCIVDQEDLLRMYWGSFIAELRGGDMKLAAPMACRVDQLFTIN